METAIRRSFLVINAPAAAHPLRLQRGLMPIVYCGYVDLPRARILLGTQPVKAAVKMLPCKAESIPEKSPRRPGPFRQEGAGLKNARKKGQVERQGLDYQARPSGS